MVKAGGENVVTLQAGSYRVSHPAINAAGGVGLPDARLREDAVAFVRLNPSQTLTEQEVADHCRGKIASYKVPRHVLFIDEFPMTGSGKVQKVKLREEARRRLAQS